MGESLGTKLGGCWKLDNYMHYSFSAISVLYILHVHTYMYLLAALLICNDFYHFNVGC